MGNVAHALVVADGQRQEGNDHHATIGHIAVEKIQGISDPHVFGRFVDVVDEGVDTLGEVVSGRDFDIGTRGRFCGKVGCSFQIAMPGLGLHLVRH